MHGTVRAAGSRAPAASADRRVRWPGRAGFGISAVWRRLGFVLFACWLASSCALAAEQVPTIALYPTMRGLPLEGRVGVLIDDGGTLTIDDVRSGAMQQRFEVPQRVVETGYDLRARWFKIRLRQGAASGEWLLVLSSLRARDLRFFGPFDDTGEELAPPVTTGIAYPYTTRPRGYEHFTFRIQLPEPGSYTVYLRAQSALPQSYRMTVWDLGLFATAQQNARLFSGISYGVIIGVMIYALLMYRTFRDRIYRYFLVGASLALVTLAMLNGHLMRYLFPDFPLLGEPVVVLVPAIWVIFGMQFGRRFLNMRQQGRYLSRIALLLALLAAAAGVAALAGELRLSSLAVFTAAAAGLVLMPVAARATQRQGYSIVGWYLATSLAIFGTIIVLLLVDWRLLPYSLAMKQYLQVAILAEVVVLTIATGQRLPRMRLQHGRLHDRAQQLARAAQTDPLTRIANRAGLSHRALELLAPDARRTLLIIDLDHFKPINDEFGHEVGDEVLVRIARRLTRLTGPRDVVARLGGDEFALLLTEPSERDAVDAFARRLIDAVSAPIEVDRQDHRVGASVGIALYPDNGDNLSRLMRRADLALYRVKRKGRNGHAFFDDLPPDVSSFSELAQ